MGKAAGGLQESFEKAIQQQSAEFKEMVTAAQKQMEQQFQQFQTLVSAAIRQEQPKETVLQAKVIDGGLWLNNEASDVLLKTLDSMQALLQELQKDQK